MASLVQHDLTVLLSARACARQPCRMSERAGRRPHTRRPNVVNVVAQTGADSYSAPRLPHPHRTSPVASAPAPAARPDLVRCHQPRRRPCAAGRSSPDDQSHDNNVTASTSRHRPLSTKKNGANADDECVFDAAVDLVLGRGLHSSTFQLNLSLLCPFPLNVSLLCPPYNPWMCPEGAQVELSRVRCVPTVLKLSSEVSECKPLVLGEEGVAGVGCRQEAVEDAKPVFEERMDRGLGLRRALSDETQSRPFQPMGGEVLHIGWMRTVGPADIPPALHCSPFNSRHKGSHCVAMAWRASFARPWRLESESGGKVTRAEGGNDRMCLEVGPARHCGASHQGLTLVHFSAQPEPFLTQNTPQTPRNAP